MEDLLALRCEEKDGVYEVLGVVVAGVSDCPPCPPRVTCTRCRPPFIAIADRAADGGLARPLHVVGYPAGRHPVGELVTIDVQMGRTIVDPEAPSNPDNHVRVVP